MSEEQVEGWPVCQLCAFWEAKVEALGGALVCEGCQMLGRVMDRLTGALVNAGWSAKNIADGVRIVVEREFTEKLDLHHLRPRTCLRPGCEELFIAPPLGDPTEAGEDVLCPECVERDAAV